MKRILGFILLAVAIIGVIFAIATLDVYSAQVTQRFGLTYLFAQGRTFSFSVGRAGVMPFGLVIALFSAIGLVGVGVLIFGKRE